MWSNNGDRNDGCMDIATKTPFNVDISPFDDKKASSMSLISRQSNDRKRKNIAKESGKCALDDDTIKRTARRFSIYQEKTSFGIKLSESKSLETSNDKESSATKFVFEQTREIHSLSGTSKEEYKVRVTVVGSKEVYSEAFLGSLLGGPARSLLGGLL